jgi:hypothetical protein
VYWVVSSRLVPCAVSSREGDAPVRVEAGRRLVEEQHRRRGDQAGGDVQPPAHPAGVGADQPPGRVEQLEALQQLLGAPAGFLSGKSVKPSDHAQVLAAGQIGVDRGVLARQADQPPDRARLCDDVEAGNAPPAAVGCERRRQDPHGGGLARPVRAKQRQHLARPKLEIDAVERPHRAEALCQPFGQNRRLPSRPGPLVRRGHRCRSFEKHGG